MLNFNYAALQMLRSGGVIGLSPFLAESKKRNPMAEAHQLSATDRRTDDAKYQEAEDVVKKIEQISKN